VGAVERYAYHPERPALLFHRGKIA
jgi:hypothetical protein